MSMKSNFSTCFYNRDNILHTSVYLGIFPNQYTDIVNDIKSPFIDSQRPTEGISNKLIYFPGKTDTKVTTFNDYT